MSALSLPMYLFVLFLFSVLLSVCHCRLVCHSAVAGSIHDFVSCAGGKNKNCNKSFLCSPSCWLSIPLHHTHVLSVVVLPTPLPSPAELSTPPQAASCFLSSPPSHVHSQKNKKKIVHFTLPPPPNTYCMHTPPNLQLLSCVVSSPFVPPDLVRLGRSNACANGATGCESRPLKSSCAGASGGASS